MAQFAVFFTDGAGFGIEMVQAMDAAHAQDIARAQTAMPGDGGVRTAATDRHVGVKEVGQPDPLAF